MFKVNNKDTRTRSLVGLGNHIGYKKFAVQNL